MNWPTSSNNSFFTNYENEKLLVENIEFFNFLLLIIVAILILITTRRKSLTFLDKIETEQLKGIAILFVILGHLWVHVCQNQPVIILSGDAVALFLILSGFGLTMSTKGEIFSFWKFIIQRLKRVMIPYWYATVLFIALDSLILGRRYLLKDMAFTILGINTNITTMHIDYVRWYITFQIFWYIIFSVIFSKIKIIKGWFLLFVVSVFLFHIDYYFLGLGWYQIFAFPLGCLIGRYYHGVKEIFDRYGFHFLILSSLLILSVGIF